MTDFDSVHESANLSTRTKHTSRCKITFKSLFRTWQHQTVKKSTNTLGIRKSREQNFFRLRRRIAADVLILVEQVDGFHGWTGYHYGKPISKTKYENFLKTNRYICDW